ncbi:hypothetical protein V2J09_022743 [Rumex salicifolius]
MLPFSLNHFKEDVLKWNKQIFGNVQCKKDELVKRNEWLLLGKTCFVSWKICRPSIISPWNKRS